MYPMLRRHHTCNNKFNMCYHPRSKTSSHRRNMSTTINNPIRILKCSTMATLSRGRPLYNIL